MTEGSITSIATAGVFVDEPLLPDPSDVRAGILYGVGGTQFTGTLAALEVPAVEDGALRDSPAFVIQQYLINTVSLFSSPEDGSPWPLYISSLPDSEKLKGDIGAIYDRVGIANGRLMSTGKNIDHPGFQIILRAIDYQEGWKRGVDVVSALETVFRYPITIGENSYVIENITKTTPFSSVGIEPGTKRRHVFTVNYIITLKGV